MIQYLVLYLELTLDPRFSKSPLLVFGYTLSGQRTDEMGIPPIFTNCSK